MGKYPGKLDDLVHAEDEIHPDHRQLPPERRAEGDRDDDPPHGDQQALGFPRLRRFSPSTLPTRIPLALPIPVLMQITRFFTTVTMELAAVASVPRWPMMTEYTVTPPPQAISFKKMGKLYFQNSRSRAKSIRNSFLPFTRTTPDARK